MQPNQMYLIFHHSYTKNGNFQIDLEVRGGPGEFFHGQVIIKIGLNFHFLGVTKSPRPPQNLAVLTAVLSTVGGGHQGPRMTKRLISQPFMGRFSKFLCLVKACENRHILSHKQLHIALLLAARGRRCGEG